MNADNNHGNIGVYRHRRFQFPAMDATMFPVHNPESKLKFCQRPHQSGVRMSPEEQLAVMVTLSDVAAGHSEEPRRLALVCLVGFGNDGIVRIIDLIDDL